MKSIKNADSNFSQPTDIADGSTPSCLNEPGPSNASKRKTPAQDAVLREILLLECDINSLNVRKNADLMTSKEFEDLKNKNKELVGARKRLEKLQKGQVRSNKNRNELKRKLNQLSTENTEAAKLLKMNAESGRPNLESTQPGLLETIINIATYGNAVDGRRRTELIHTIKTLDDLVAVLKNYFGYNVSRSAIYLRLIPRRIDSIEGKKHIYTVPVKLMKAQNSAHKEHMDSKFAAATIHNLELLSSVLGPKEECFKPR